MRGGCCGGCYVRGGCCGGCYVRGGCCGGCYVRGWYMYVLCTYGCDMVHFPHKGRE